VSQFYAIAPNILMALSFSTVNKILVDVSETLLPVVVNVLGLPSPSLVLILSWGISVVYYNNIRQGKD
jgi:hypothetical protein